MKLYLRSQNRLNHCMLLHVHKDKTQKLNLCQLAEQLMILKLDFLECFNNYCTCFLLKDEMAYVAMVHYTFVTA